MVDTRHAVGCRALRGGVPCTCWIDSKTVDLAVAARVGQSPLWLAIERLREQSARPHITRVILVQVADVEQVLDALADAEKVAPWHHADGGEA